MQWSLNRREWMGVTGALLCAGIEPATAAERGEEITELLRQAHREHKLAALLAGVWQGDREIATVALGNSMTGVPATKEMHMRVGGVTLTCVCMVLLRLVEAGKIRLEDKLSRWFPKLPKADQVTLRMLANCTSGYPDYVLSEEFVDDFHKNPFRPWRAAELIDVAFDKPLLYEPGKGWNYSHTNFVILGEVLQKVTGMSMPAVLEKHIFKPLKLKETEYPLTARIKPPVLHAFSTERDVYEDSTYWNPSWTSHSGQMTSTLGELGALARALGSGELLSEKSRQEQVVPTTVGLGKNRDGLYYALGIVLMNGWMVQNPRFGGYNLIFAHHRKRALSIVIISTEGPHSTPAGARALIFKELVKRLAPESPIPEQFK